MDFLRNFGFYFFNEVLVFENLLIVLLIELKNIYVIEFFLFMKENNKVVKWIILIFKMIIK